MNVIKIRKNGTFYHVYDDDTYILYYLFAYSIKDSKVGFPMGAFDKVIDKLNELKINYNVVNDNISMNFKNANKYNKYKELGLNKYNKDIYLNDMVDKLKNISEEKFNIIMDYVEKVLEE